MLDGHLFELRSVDICLVRKCYPRFRETSKGTRVSLEVNGCKKVIDTDHHRRDQCAAPIVKTTYGYPEYRNKSCC